MLATQLNHFITNNEVVQNGVIQLDRYICNAVSGIKIIIILGMTQSCFLICTRLPKQTQRTSTIFFKQQFGVAQSVHMFFF